MKHITGKRRILLILTVVCMTFIFVQSVLPKSVSSDESGWLLEHVLNPIAKRLGLRPFSNQTVRKIAHVIEFLVLSGLLVFCFCGRIAVSGGVSFLTAFLDESIQLLSGRGAQITDVWIDLIGVAVGTALGFLILKARGMNNGNESKP